MHSGSAKRGSGVGEIKKTSSCSRIHALVCFVMYNPGYDSPSTVLLEDVTSAALEQKDKKYDWRNLEEKNLCKRSEKSNDCR